MTSLRFLTDDLLELSSALLQKARVPTADADLISRSLLVADEAGIYSHGVLRLPLYLEAVAAGGIDPVARPRVIRRFGGIAVLDGGGAFGQVTMQQAVDVAAGAARDHGVSTVAVQGSTHFGAGRFWTDQLAARGMAAILTSSTGPVAAPFGGSRPTLGTNPLTLSLPSAEGHPLVADLATTEGAYGKIVAAANEGAEIPAGWGVDAAAQPTTDPSSVLEGGALLPFGGHKGSGVSVLLEGLATAFTGASAAFSTVDIWQDRSSRMNTGHLLLALDLAAFGDVEDILANVAALQAEVRGSRPGSEVVAPGDLEHRSARQDPGHVEIAASTAAALRALAVEHGLSFPDGAGTDEATS